MVIFDENDEVDRMEKKSFSIYFVSCIVIYNHN